MSFEKLRRNLEQCFRNLLRVLGIRKPVIADGNIVPRTHSFEGISQLKRYLQALDELPTGYYAVECRGGREVITSCNRSFANIFGYHSPSEVVGREVGTLYSNPGDRNSFRTFLAKMDQEGKGPLTGYNIQMKRKDGSTFWVAIDAKVLRDTTGQVLGREGTVRDITREVLLQQQVEHLRDDLEKTTQDMDQFMHRYISPMMRLDAALLVQEKMLYALKPFPSEKAEVTTSGESWASRLESALKATLDEAESGNLGLNSLRTNLKSLYKRLPCRRSSGLPTVDEVIARGVALETLSLLNSMSPEEKDASASLRQLEQTTRQILEEAIWRSTKRLRAETKALNAVIESLRQYLFYHRAVSEYEFRECDLGRVLASNIEVYTPMAEEKGLTIQLSGDKHLRAEIAEPHIDRMISNLLLNAIKYSYRRAGTGFISVKTSQDKLYAKLEITNYGVPIARDELETGRVFEYGYRGRFSRDYNRTGSGVGLADVKQTVEVHGGTIEIESRPAAHGHKEDPSDVPFLTTVSIKLPKHHSQGGNSH